MTGFAFAIVVLESGALTTWAERLDVGPARARAMRMAAVVHNKLQPLRMEQVRTQALAGLDRIGWTDDPARLSAASPKPASVARSVSPCPGTPRAPGRGNPRPRSAAKVAVPSTLPRVTPLAPLPSVAQGQPRVVALVGDSMMAVGLSNMLLRETASNENLLVIKAFRSGTGLARPDVFDWMEEYPAMLGDQKPDAIIVAIGANDGQGFVEEGNVLPFGSDEWVKVYAQRITDFLSLLTQDGARVVWVGLPPMKSGAYNERISKINRIAYAVISQNPQATWWNPQSYIADESGGFRESETDAAGRATRIRAADGIHLSDEGAALLTPSLIDWLNTAAPVQTAQAAPAETPAAAPGSIHERHRPHGRTVRR